MLFLFCRRLLSRAPETSKLHLNTSREDKTLLLSSAKFLFSLSFSLITFPSLSAVFISISGVPYPPGGADVPTVSGD